MKPLISPDEVLLIMFTFIFCTCILCFFAVKGTTLATDENAIYYVLGLVVVALIVIFARLVSKLLEYQQLCNKFIED